MAITVSKVNNVSGKIVVAFYLRVSRLGDRLLRGESFHSPDIQIAEITAEANTVYGVDGWELADVEGNYGRGIWADLGVSGTDERRAGLDAAIDACAAHGIHALGVLNLSRWARSVLGALRRMEELEENGAELISAKERTNFKTPQGRFLTVIFLAAAELYAEEKSAGWSDLIELRASKGQHHGTPPSGMRRPLDPVTGERHGDIEPDPDVAPLVTEAFRRIDLGASAHSTGMWLMEKGVISASTQIKNLLANRAYLKLHGPTCAGSSCGRQDQHGSHGEVRARVLETVTRSKKRRTEERWFPAVHQGLVDPALFDRVQDRIKTEPQRSGGRRSKVAKHELAGVVRCAYCLRALACDSRRGRVTMLDNSGRDIGCGGPGTITASLVLDIVLDELRHVLGELSDESIRSAAAATRPASIKRKPQSRRTLIDRRKVAIEKSAEIGAALALGDYPGTQSEAEAVQNKLRAEVERIDDQLAEAAATPVAPAVWGPQRAADLLEQWESLSVDGRNEALRGLLTVFVGRRDPDGPFRQPYAERLSIRWAWEQ